MRLTDVADPYVDPRVGSCVWMTVGCVWGMQFLEQELLVNITKHVLVPKHEVLTREQKQQLLTRSAPHIAAGLWC